MVKQCFHHAAWVDDAVILGPPELAEKMQEQLEKAFTCKHKGTLTEYVSSKITMGCNDGRLRTVQFTKPILICRL
jgi:hypothetical protein